MTGVLLLPLWSLGLLAATALAPSCRRSPICPSGHEETKLNPEAIWCHDRKAKTSVYIQLYPGTRQFRQRCQFAGGTPEGPFQAAHPGGQKWIDGGYEKGRLAGRWIQWDANGSKVAEGEYRDGRLVSGAPIAVAALCDSVPRVE